MDTDLNSVANQFYVYSQLGWYYRWKFRQHLSWLGQDRVSLGHLLDFEKELREKSLSFFRITEILEDVLTWYYREAKDDRLPDRIPPERLSALLQILITFYRKSLHLHRSYRGLLLDILKAEEEIKRHREDGPAIPPEQFRLEAAKAISSLGKDWGDRDPIFLKNVADPLLSYLTNIAQKTSNLQLFTQFQIQAANTLAVAGMWSWGEKLNCLETMAAKVDDVQTFTTVFQQIVPTLGLGTTSSLLRACKDFREFEVYYHRIDEQLKSWRSDYIALFARARSTSELDRLLVFLGTLAKNERMAKHIQYTQSHYPGVLRRYMSDCLPTYKALVLDGCWNYDWTREPDYQQLMDAQIDRFEQTIVDAYLSTVWTSTFPSHKIRWEFNKFTDYIPCNMQSLDWTIDNDKMRPYWNAGEIEGRERNRYRTTLGPLLRSLFRHLSYSELEVLFNLLPNYLSTQEFTSTVKVPVEWENSIEYQEGYNHWAGYYTEKIEVARPRVFMDHTFTFQRPDLKNAIDFLSDINNIRKTIRAHKKFRGYRGS